MIRYRKPGLDDPAIIRLIETELEPLSHLSPKELEQVRKELPVRLGRGVTLVASDGAEGRVYGFVHFMMHGELLFIDMLAVAPAARRKRWGASLMERAEHFARSRGCSRAKLMVDLGNYRGLSFYQRLGYGVVRMITPNQCYEMGKTL